MSCIDGVENIVGMGENDGYQHFLLLPQCFPKSDVPGSFKHWIVWQSLYPLPDDKILDWYNLIQIADDI